MEKNAMTAEIMVIILIVCTQQAIVCSSSSLCLSISRPTISRSSLDRLSNLYSGALNILYLPIFHNYNIKRTTK